MLCSKSEFIHVVSDWTACKLDFKRIGSNIESLLSDTDREQTVQKIAT
jgi:hypothetical protein